MQNISSFHNAFFQEFVSCFQLASVTLWLSLSIFHSFSWSLSSSTHHYFRPLTDVKAEQNHHSHVQKSHLTERYSWNHSISSTSSRTATPHSATTCQLRDKHSRDVPTRSSSWFDFLSAYNTLSINTRNVWKQAEWSMYIPQKCAQRCETYYSGFTLSECLQTSHLQILTVFVKASVESSVIAVGKQQWSCFFLASI